MFLPVVSKLARPLELGARLFDEFDGLGVAEFLEGRTHSIDAVGHAAERKLVEVEQFTQTFEVHNHLPVRKQSSQLANTVPI
ncbi:MAG: hypothetical protein ABEN55_01905, partial [Bradymonadaceae bacterium]